MAELLAKLFDITKLPSKLLAWAVLLTGAYLFSPDAAVKSLHLDSLPREYKAYAGIAFVAAGSLLLINAVLWLWSKARSVYSKRTLRKMVAAALLELDFEEVVVLREFYIQGRHVIELPVDHPTVAGLRNKHLVQVAGGTGYRDLAGSVFPVQLTREAKRLLTAAALGLPEDRTEENIQRILRERPNYMSQIEKQDRLRGGHFW